MQPWIYVWLKQSDAEWLTQRMLSCKNNNIIIEGTKASHLTLSCSIQHTVECRQAQLPAVTHLKVNVTGGSWVGSPAFTSTCPHLLWKCMWVVYHAQLAMHTRLWYCVCMWLAIASVVLWHAHKFNLVCVVNVLGKLYWVFPAGASQWDSSS